MLSWSLFHDVLMSWTVLYAVQEIYCPLLPLLPTDEWLRLLNEERFYYFFKQESFTLLICGQFIQIMPVWKFAVTFFEDVIQSCDKVTCLLGHNQRCSITFLNHLWAYFSVNSLLVKAYFIQAVLMNQLCLYYNPDIFTSHLGLGKQLMCFLACKKTASVL